MRNEKLSDIDRLTHILDNTKVIQIFVKGLSKQDFLNDLKTKYACAKALQDIGEAAARISDKMRIEYNNIDWRSIVGVRNIITHEYFGIDYQVVWNIITDDIPVLEDQIKEILNSLLL